MPAAPPALSTSTCQCETKRLFPTITKGKPLNSSSTSCFWPNCSAPTTRPSMRRPLRMDW